MKPASIAFAPLAAFMLSPLHVQAAPNAQQTTPMTLQEAIAKVRREVHAKVLSAETRPQGNKTVYRIKVLTHDGQVMIVEVPAE